MPADAANDRFDRIAGSLSAPRLGPYLQAAQGSTRLGLQLYRWNIELSAAAYEVLHLTEITLRNALDEQLRPWNASQKHADKTSAYGSEWLLDPSPLITRLSGTDISRARERLSRTRPARTAVSHDDVLAALGLGTWRYLLPDRDQGRRRLWSEALRFAFPHLGTTPRMLTTQVNTAYRLRNRIAHLEPIGKPAYVLASFNSMRAIIQAIDPVVDEWMTSWQRVTAVLRLDPRR